MQNKVQIVVWDKARGSGESELRSEIRQFNIPEFTAEQGHTAEQDWRRDLDLQGLPFNSAEMIRLYNHKALDL